ncbi:hypothetical protein G3N59_01035 [Paraburkholderia sp. Ac-20340]|uniref:hypothetical protein n=1 Tax=Paraburkholderia sp. Ac-20340 TaxID=2703888 RepID=UPI00197F7A75|nr:hypothetical protein [Paraburkholderia sp. Ac-20340]MBN3851951.1 hypothetical protein [Paraburkholderia sp. Ac-20340]
MYKCACCGSAMPNILAAPTEWEWFTGYLPERVVFCPAHIGTRLRNILRKMALDPETRAKYLHIGEALDAARKAEIERSGGEA